MGKSYDEVMAAGFFRLTIKLEEAFLDPMEAQAELAAAADAWQKAQTDAAKEQAYRVAKVRADMAASTAEQRQAWLGHWVQMRELRGDELLTLAQDGEGNMAAQLEKRFPACVLDHSLLRGSEKVSTDELMAALKSSGTVFMYAVNTWGSSLPLRMMRSRS